MVSNSMRQRQRFYDMIYYVSYIVCLYVQYINANNPYEYVLSTHFKPLCVIIVEKHIQSTHNIHDDPPGHHHVFALGREMQ